MLERKREECANKIRDLGTVAREELEALQGKHRKALMKDLKKVNADLKKYAHVNRKAIDQHQAFARRRDELRRRRGGMTSAAEKLNQMISLLDRRKDKALLRTFRGVAQHFASVFSELVPRGHGRLYMRVGKRKRAGEEAKAAGGDDEEEEEEVEDAAEGKEAEDAAGSGAVERKEGDSEDEDGLEQEGEFDLTSDGLTGLDFDDEEAAKAVGEQEAGGGRKGRRRRGAADDDDDDEEEEEEEDDSEGEEDEGRAAGEGETSEELERVLALVPRFKGVSIKVSFNERDTPHPMQTLSGGQATLVALALIFAIQRCDPAPFYLFDEIDQALDPTHRRAVAALVQRQAHSKRRAAQFITTTFRPELVRVADRWFGIAFEHKSSRVVSQTQAQALGFVHTIMQEEDAAAQTVSKKAAGAAAGGGGGAAASASRGSSSKRRTVAMAEEDEEEEED